VTAHSSFSAISTNAASLLSKPGQYGTRLGTVAIRGWQIVWLVAAIASSEGDMRKREIIKDTIGLLLVGTLAIVFGTNAVTDDWNIWALMVWFGN